MSEWMPHKLSELMEIIGGGTPKTNVASYWNGNIPWLSVVDFNSGLKYVRITEKQISQEGLENSSTKKLNKGDIIISARGTVGAMAMLDIPMTFNQSCYGLRCKSPLKSQDYLFYLVKDSINELMQISHGGVFDTITKATFDEVSVNIPEDEREQQAIAEVLSSLDNKIDLLHRNNITLEQMAETLFRQWFVVEAKEEWEEKKVSDIIEIRDGTHDSPKQAENGRYLVTSKNLRPNEIDFTSAYKISEADYHLINKRSVVEEGDILISMIGTLGLLHLVVEKPDYAIKNIGLFKSSQKPWFSRFLLLLLKSPVGKNYIYENADGSTQEYISLGSLRKFSFNYPGEERIRAFDNQVEPLLNKVKHNSAQIRTLSKTRDILLPKLMSGQVMVKTN